MQIDRPALETRLARYASLGLLAPREIADVLRALASDFAFADAVARAESIHLHVRVDDVGPSHEALCALGGVPENARAGYVKYRSHDGVHLILSSIDVAEDDRVPALAGRARPHLDHVGVDVREDSPASRALFDALPARAAESSWRYAHQGGAGAPVACCHTSVAEKHWFFPPSDARIAIPIEIAYGPLLVSDGQGCDLRPLDPTAAAIHAAPSACCDPAKPTLRSLGKKPATAL